MTVVVFLDEDSTDDAVAWVYRSPVHRYAAMRFTALVDVTSHEVVFWDGPWTRGSVFRDIALALLRKAVIATLDRVLPEQNTRLSHRRAPGTEEQKIADALRASQAAMRHNYAILAPVVLVSVVAILFIIGGVGPALTGLVLWGSASAVRPGSR